MGNPIVLGVVFFGVITPIGLLMRVFGRDALVYGQLLHTLREVQVLSEWWRVFYNTYRPHSSLGCQRRAPVTRTPIEVLRMRQEAGQANLEL